MSGRSPSGVASLRARFEQNKESTSPPSRGRSPAGSATSDHSRPISKVRTSFVSVEGSGRMGEQLNTKDTDRGETVPGIGMEGSNTAVNGAGTEKPETNGDSLPEPAQAETSVSKGDVKPEPTMNGSAAAGLKPTGMDGTSDASPDKPVSAAEDNSAGMLPADPKDEKTISGGAALGGDTAGLGSILKGSPFEQNGEKKATPSKSSKPKAAIANPHSPKTQTKAPSNGIANSKPKETTASKPAAQSKSKITGAVSSAQAKSAPPSGPPDGPSASDSKPEAAARPATIETGSTGPPAPSTEEMSKEFAESKLEKTIPPEPRTPTSATGITKQPTPSKASPKPGKPKESKKETAKDIRKSTARESAVSKPPPSAAVKPTPKPSSSTANSVKKSNPTSPKPAFTKPRPKSPTRPARLPAAATAPTAASAAKLDGAPPPTNDRKPVNHLSTRDRVPSNPSKSQSKPARTSLPIGSKPAEKPKASGPRQSMASSKAPEGSFLDRMMRPTRSSSQKTHEKVEVKTPPKKHHVAKPKRTSEGSDRSKADHAGDVAEPAKEPGVSAKETTAEPGQAPSMEEASASVSAAAHTIPSTISVP